MTCRRGRGLTLIETMVVTAVFILLVITIIELFTGGVRAWRKGRAQADLRAAARKAADQIASDFRQAHQVDVPLNVNVINNQLAITRAYRDTSQTTVTYTSDDVTYTFDTSNNTLVREESGQTVVLAEDVVYSSDGTRSYFKLRSGTDKAVLDFALYMAEDSLTLNTQPNKVRETFKIASAAYMQTAQVGYSQTSTGGTVLDDPVANVLDVTDIRAPSAVSFRRSR